MRCRRSELEDLHLAYGGNLLSHEYGKAYQSAAIIPTARADLCTGGLRQVDREPLKIMTLAAPPLDHPAALFGSHLFGHLPEHPCSISDDAIARAAVSPELHNASR